MITSRDVAARAGVSQSTVSRALAGDPRVAEATRERVLAAARELGYFPEAAARSLATNTSSTIGVVVDDLRNPFFLEIIDDLHRGLVAAGLHTVLIDDREALDGRGVPAALMNAGLGGLVFVSARTWSTAPGLAADLGLPVIVLNRDVDDEHAGIDRVVSDNDMGGAIAADHLADLGHTRIAFISGPADTSTARAREAGFRRALTARGVAIDDTLRREGPYSHHTGSQFATELLGLPEPPTAILCGNDVIAFGALDAARRMSVSVPGDVSIMGYDDVKLAGWSTMALTTVHQPLDLMARTTARMIVQRVQGEQPPAGRHQVFPVGLVRRGTTGAVAHAS